MTPFEIQSGPLVEFYQVEAGYFEKTFATEVDCDQAHAYYLRITNTSNASLWIEDIFFRLNVGIGYDSHSLIPVFPNRHRSYPSALPAPLRGHRFTVEYAVPFEEIAPVVAKAIGIRIRYRKYYLPVPIFSEVDYSGESFWLFTRALRSRARRGHA